MDTQRMRAEMGQELRKETNMDFRHIWRGLPIDFWEYAMVANIDEEARVLRQMPEEPRDGSVFKVYVPFDCCLVPLFMCKADNNGSVYFFCDFDIVHEYTRSWEAL